MLYLFESDRLDSLFRAFSEVLFKGETRSILQPVKVIVPNQDTGRWLHVKLAEKFGISAFIQPVLPAFFIHELNLKLDADYERKLPDKNEYAWRLYEILKTRGHESVFKHLHDFIEDDDLKGFQIAGVIADLFDQYVLFRSEMILSWNQGKRFMKDSAHEGWQLELWSALRDQNPSRTDRATLFQALSVAIDERKLEINEPFIVFNPGMIPPSYARIFAQLSKNTSVHWFRNDSVLSQKLPIHPLVSMLGEDHLNGAKMLNEALSGIPVQKRVVERDDSAKDTILQKLQSAIKERGGLPASASDNSIQVHACHNALREIQVLQDAILDFLETTPDAGPEDILVVSSDLTSYSGFIDAVFNAPHENTPKLPVFVNDVGSSVTSQTIALFLELISIQKSRFKLSSILDVLERKAVRDRFGLTDQQLSLLEKWMKDTGLRWGIDASNRGDSGIHSWEFAIDRLISGFMMPHFNQDISLDIAPYSEVEGAEGLHLTGFVYQLKDWFSSWDAFLSKSHTSTEWAEKLREGLHFWIPDTDEYQRAISNIQKVIRSLQDTEKYLSKTQTLSAEIVLEFIQGNLSATSAGSSFRSGAITFSSMVPVRHLPYRFIAVLGLNEHQFPGNDTRNSFDLMEKDFKPGDRSIRITNKGLFLDALMTASDVFYMSYTGFKMADGSAMPASLVVSELLEYLKREGCSIPIKKHRLHAFHPDYFKGEGSSHFTYQKKNQFLARLYNEINPPKLAGDRVDIPLEIPEQEMLVTLNELYAFLRKPFTWLMQTKLGMRRLGDEALPDDRDVFGLNNLEMWKFDQLFMRAMKEQEDVKTLYNRFKQSGMLPYGIAAELEFNEAYRRFSLFWDAIPPEIKTSSTDKSQRVEAEFNIHDKHVLFRATIPETIDGQLTLVEASKLNPDRKLLVWLIHLCANLIAEVHTIAVFKDAKKEGIHTLAFSPNKNAAEILSSLIGRMISTRNTPIPAYPMMFEEYENILSKHSDLEKIEAETLNKWHGYFNPFAFDMAKTAFKDDAPISDFTVAFDQAWFNDILALYDLVWKPMTENGGEL